MDENKRIGRGLGDLGDERYFESHDEEEQQAKIDRRVTDEQEVLKQLSEWIDTMNIAETIVSALTENGKEANLADAKGVWLHACYSLHSFVEGSIDIEGVD